MCDDDNIADQGSNASRKADGKVYKMSGIVSGVNKNWQRLQDSYRQNSEEWAAKEDEYTRRLNDKDTEMADLKATIESLKQELKQETEKYGEALKKKQQTDTENVALNWRQMAFLEEKDRDKANIEFFKNALEETRKGGKKKSAFKKRLSKLEGAHLTLNNPNITDLSDMNRPTRLAEKYSELYEDEWTDAFEERTDPLHVDEEACVKTMLDLLKTANDECLKLIQPHRDILKTLTVVTVKLHKSAVKQVPLNSTEDNYAQTDLTSLDTDSDKEECQSTGEQVHANNKNVLTGEKIFQSNDNEESMDSNEDNKTMQNTQMEMTEISGRSQCQQYDPSFPTQAPGKQQNTEMEMTEISGRSQCQQNHPSFSTQVPEKQAISVDELPFETNIDTGEETADIIINGKFTEEQKKIVSDMRKLCGTKLEQEGSISKVIAMKIARERRVDIKSSKHLMTYITKCAQLCWYMAIQEPPVVIGFREPAADEYFNKDIYKAYTKVGKKLDYVVWPAVYLHKDGPMLCKGTAQGKD